MRKTRRLRLVPPAEEGPCVVTIEYPPGSGDDFDSSEVLAVEVPNSAFGLARGDLACVWWESSPASGELAAVEVADGTVYVQPVRHGPGGYITATRPDGVEVTLKPSEYRRVGRVYCVERGGKVVRRF